MNRHSFLVLTFIFSICMGIFAQTQSFQVAGVNREYIVYAPGGLGNNPPLVLQIHSYNIDMTMWRSICKMDNIANREKFIVVYPNAINKNWNMSGGDDLTFLRALVDTIDARYHIDRNRIYATGFSQGGFMSFLLGCQYSDVFAAIAPVSGMLNGTCTLKRPVPLFFTFGTNESVAAVEKFLPSLTNWLKYDSCPSTPVVTRPYPASNPQSVITRLTYGPCAQGSEVVVDTVSGGPHEWAMDTKAKVNTSEEVWTFFKKFTLNGTTAVSRQPYSAVHNTVAASYSYGVIRLQGAKENCLVRVIDIRGRLVTVEAVTQRQFTFGNNPGGVYVLMVNGKNGPVAIRMAIP